MHLKNSDALPFGGFVRQLGGRDDFTQAAGIAAGHRPAFPLADLCGQAVAEVSKLVYAIVGGREIALRQLEDV